MSDLPGRTYLRRIQTLAFGERKDQFPLNVPAFSQGLDLKFTSPVAFLVGSNGSGKSTLIEAIADKSGFNLAGGSRNHHYDNDDTAAPLSPHLRLSWQPKATEGFFLRAETYFNFRSYIDALNPKAYAWREESDSTHEQSHGESFLSLFTHRFTRGLFILDEPEAALSPISQLAFMSIINKLIRAGESQFIIATHSPLLICYPEAQIFVLSETGIHQRSYQETEQYQITKNFLDSPERYFKHLFSR